ncbi:MAG: hypothetical protein H0U45_13385 [Tatlockia sp.]|nr:hypothetical protein [Tatlockia sp.]
MSIHNPHQLALALKHQPLKKGNEHLCRQFLGVEAASFRMSYSSEKCLQEADFTLITNAGNVVDINSLRATAIFK